MNRFILTTIFVLCVLMSPRHGLTEPFDNCPITVGSNTLGPPFPDSDNWYGSEALAVVLPADGIWGITGPDARIAVKLFWRSAGFKPGMESNLKVNITNLNGKPNDAVVKDVTNAGADAESLDGWAMLTGIDFPSPGCWQITGEYLGQSLIFVVATVDFEDYPSDDI
jgi:hypothetical protein